MRRRDCAELPDDVSFEAASTLPVAGLTALRTLAVGGSALGRRVLVTGAAGGVGRFAVQLAARAGAHVTAVAASPERAAGLRELGAHEIVEDLEPAGEAFDVILESVGGPSLAAALQRVAPDGVVVSFGDSSGEPVQLQASSFYRRTGATVYAFMVFRELDRHASGRARPRHARRPRGGGGAARRDRHDGVLARGTRRGRGADGPARARQGRAGGRLTMPRRDERVVWSSDGGDRRKAQQRAGERDRVRAGDGRVRVRRETSGRRGKAVTTVSGVPVADAELRELAGRLKKRCGVGGTVKDGIIELQGDHRDAVVEVLRADGYDVVLAGG